VGCELAQAYAGFGVAVTLVEAATQLVSGEDAALAAELATVLRGSHVDIRLGAEMKAMEATGSGQARALLAGGPVIEAEQVILAVGRSPATAGLGLDAIGITQDDTGANSQPSLREGRLTRAGRRTANRVSDRHRPPASNAHEQAICAIAPTNTYQISRHSYSAFCRRSRRSGRRISSLSVMVTVGNFVTADASNPLLANPARFRPSSSVRCSVSRMSPCQHRRDPDQAVSGSSGTDAMASCPGKSEILSPPDPGGCGSNSPGPSRIRTPSPRNASTLSLKGARPASAELTKGRATTGMPRPGT
jgi:hypothetical protein